MQEKKSNTCKFVVLENGYLLCSIERLYYIGKTELIIKGKK